MKIRPRQSARETAAALLPRLAEKLFQAGDELVGGEGGADRVHPFRIQTKRLRYVLEYFRPCYGEAMDAHIQAIKSLQQVLGELTDCYTTQAVLEGVLRMGKSGRLQSLAGAMGSREAELTSQFSAFWRQTFPRGARRQFFQYLARPRPNNGAAPASRHRRAAQRRPPKRARRRRRGEA